MKSNNELRYPKSAVKRLARPNNKDVSLRDATTQTPFI